MSLLVSYTTSNTDQSYVWPTQQTQISRMYDPHNKVMSHIWLICPMQVVSYRWLICVITTSCLTLLCMPQISHMYDTTLLSYSHKYDATLLSYVWLVFVWQQSDICIYIYVYIYIYIYIYIYMCHTYDWQSRDVKSCHTYDCGYCATSQGSLD